ncbi:hypothetical protein J2X69_003992 [Algoriphagus sp. 4150]|uniref:hypothetical protein n=1 Tax=Algoriphagus sp. 4150 TaxID=2817756 RepID=UPI0028618956|nr:hypothetical protein [Algoriphagus sp. 4150]MDR7131628.1 hypothetical protein [Algoriphagus sp. 4150]
MSIRLCCILMFVLMSCDSFYNHITLVNKKSDSVVVLKLDDDNSYLSVSCKLLDSKSSIRPSHVIFTTHIVSRGSNIHFESNDSLIYFCNSNGDASSGIVTTNKDLTNEKTIASMKNKVEVIGMINHFNIKVGENIRFGLKLPPIIIDGNKINIEMIEFGLQ